MDNLVRLWQPLETPGAYRETHIYFPAEDPTDFRTRANAHFVSKRGFVPFPVDSDPNQGAIAVQLSPEVLALPNPLELEEELEASKKASKKKSTTPKEKKATTKKSKKATSQPETALEEPVKPLGSPVQADTLMGKLFKLLESPEGATLAEIQTVLARPVDRQKIEAVLQSMKYQLEISGDRFRVLGEIQWK